MAKMRLGPGFGGLSGRAGNVVFAQTPYGTVMRDRPSRRRGQQRTPAQTQIGRNLALANAAWRSLTPAQVAAWQVYCLGLTEDNPATGLPLTPQAPHVFLGYATKLLQMNPAAQVPLDPPSTPFYGDSVQVGVSAVPGGLRVTALTPNAPGVTTEILVQKLRQVNNRPQAKSYKTSAFKAFAVGSMSVDLPLGPGAYAVAIRFVDTATGRKTPVYPVTQVVVA